MNESQISVRYAKAFFSLVKSKNLVDEANKDVELILQVFEESVPLKIVLESPTIQTSKKESIISEIFKNHISDVSLSFLKTIFENKRESFLNLILLNVQQYCRIEKGIRTALITTAVPISKEIKDELSSKINESYQCTTELSENIDEDIIGGFILQIDDVQYNASLKMQLNKIKYNLVNRA